MMMLAEHLDGEDSLWRLTDASDTIAHYWLQGGPEQLSSSHAETFGQIMDEYRPWTPWAGAQ